MKKFNLDPAKIYDLLKAKGVTHLYHANTVTTAQTFIEQDALLSRYFVEQHGLTQTPQATDEMDKSFDLWDDVFMDGFDLHLRTSEPNEFGPVLFVMKLELLLKGGLGKLSATKWNPRYWQYHPGWEDRYITDLAELNEYYLAPGVDLARIVFTFSDSGNNIVLSEFLDKIVYDEPNCKLAAGEGSGESIGELMRSALRSSLDAKGLSEVPVQCRHVIPADANCNCSEQYPLLYRDNFDEFDKRFKLQNQSLKDFRNS